VGCDGAHSAVRKAIGGVLHGDAAHQAWGVMDILANTDFPDVRQKCLISSANEGNVLVLPREGGYIFRMYVELDKLRPDEKAAHRKMTQDDIIAAANRIIKPYSLDVKEVVWWSIYDIGHSLTDKFDDVPEGEDRNPRVFTAGDACHTHSPKAGQGMNVSMQDTFNLGWKLVHVLQGRADASLLRSYSKERLTEAKRLVETDHKWSRIMSAPTTQAEREGRGGAAHHSPVQGQPGVHRWHSGQVRQLVFVCRHCTSSVGQGRRSGAPFPFGPRGARVRRQANAARPCGTGRCALAHLRLCRQG